MTLNYYVCRRLGGLELRPYQHEHFGELAVTATDWERFADFYAEYFPKEQDFENPGGDFAAVDRIEAALAAVNS